MNTISFYSYKGGVGRSVALLNVAHQLAELGRRVVLVDFDLEAPGLHSAAVTSLGAPPDALPQKGLVDFLEAAQDQARQEGTAHFPDIDLDEYISKPIGTHAAPLTLMPAGGVRRSGATIRLAGDYGARVASLSLARDGYLLRGREVLLALKSRLAERADYLLIDSRTGLTDVYGITTVLLPDSVVLLTNLTDQSIEGTRGVLDQISTYGTEAGRREKLTPEGAVMVPNAFFARPSAAPDVQALVVASPLPYGELSEVERKSERLPIPITHALYYVARIATSESAHIVRSPEGALEDPAYGMYRHLTQLLLDRNPLEPLTLEAFGYEALERQDWLRALVHFFSAEHYITEAAQRGRDGGLAEADQTLRARLKLGQARSLALGFQTGTIGDLIEEASASSNEGVTPSVSVERRTLPAERIRALLQQVRGHLGLDELLQASDAARRAYDAASVSGVREWRLDTGMTYAQSLTYVGGFDRAIAVLRPPGGTPLAQAAGELNRQGDRVLIHNQLAITHLSKGDLREAAREADLARGHAEDFRVPYVKALARLVQAQVALAMGQTSPGGLSDLSQALEWFKESAVGYYEAECLSEHGLYLHRLGGDVTEVTDHLRSSIRIYNTIPGTLLGKLWGLVYATRVLIDNGKISGPANVDAYLSPKAVEEGLDSAVGPLLLAASIADASGISNVNDLIAAYWGEILLLREEGDLDAYARELDLEGFPLEGHAPNGALPYTSFEVERSRLFVSLVSGGDVRRTTSALQTLADRAGKAGASYDAACSLGLVALAAAREGKAELGGALRQLSAWTAEVDLDLRWTVWGQAGSLYLCPEGVRGADWVETATELFKRVAQERRDDSDSPLPPLPPYVDNPYTAARA